MKIQYKRHGDNGFVMYVDGQAVRHIQNKEMDEWPNRMAGC